MLSPSTAGSDSPATDFEGLSLTNKPDEPTRVSGKDLIRVLVGRRPEDAPLMIADVVGHEWLHGVDWLSVARKEYLPLYITDLPSEDGRIL